jgi:hypothetical protein
MGNNFSKKGRREDYQILRLLWSPCVQSFQRATNEVWLRQITMRPMREAAIPMLVIADAYRHQLLWGHNYAD